MGDPGAVTAYSVVLALHIIAVLAAFGLPLAYPLLLPYLRRRHPRAMPGVHDVQKRLNLVLTGPGTVLVLGFGVYMASKHHLWHETWVQVGIGVIAAIAVIGGWVVRAAGQMAELSAADVAAAGADGPVVWGARYTVVYRRYIRVELLLGVLVLTAVFFMAAKP
jgi:uncharacterized membrane protein